MTNVNFDSLGKVNGGIFNFKAIGDTLKGTLVAKRVVTTQFNAEQKVYDILTDHGIFAVFGKPSIDQSMNFIKIGQYVKFQYTGDKPATRPGYKPAHIVEVFADSKMVNEEWLANNQDMVNVEDLAAEGFDGTMPALAPMEELVSAPFTSADKDAIIATLVKAKLPGTPDNMVIQRAMELSGLAYISSNIDKIIEALQK